MMVTRFTSINACGVWRAKAGVQVSRKEFHTYTLRLGYSRIIYCIKKEEDFFIGQVAYSLRKHPLVTCICLLSRVHCQGKEKWECLKVKGRPCSQNCKKWLDSKHVSFCNESAFTHNQKVIFVAKSKAIYKWKRTDNYCFQKEKKKWG